MGGGGLDGYFGEQGLPLGTQECLERFHRRCVGYLIRQVVPKWDSPNAESLLATVDTTSLLVELSARLNTYPYHFLKLIHFNTLTGFASVFSCPTFCMKLGFKVAHVLYSSRTTLMRLLPNGFPCCLGN